MTQDHPIHGPLNQEFNLALIRVEDDMAAVIVGASQAEFFLTEYLKSRMPNLSKKVNPLQVDSLPLALSPMAKWAFALGFVDDRIYGLCTQIGWLRNHAAHLKTGPSYQLTKEPQKARVEQLWSNSHRPGDVSLEIVQSAIKMGRSEERGKYQVCCRDMYWPDRSSAHRQPNEQSIVRYHSKANGTQGGRAVASGGRVFGQCALGVNGNALLGMALPRKLLSA